jgi:hypothetical protein
MEDLMEQLVSLRQQSATVGGRGERFDARRREKSSGVFVRAMEWETNSNCKRGQDT